MNVQRLPCVSDKCPWQNHLLSKPIILTQWALSVGRPEWICRGFPVSMLNAFYKTIFWVSLLYWLDELSPGSAAQTSRGFPFSVMNVLYETIFWVTLSYQCNKLYLSGDLEMYVEALPVSEILSCFPGDLMNIQRIPCISNEHPLQGHLPGKPIILTWWVLSPGRTKQ